MSSDTRLTRFVHWAVGHPQTLLVTTLLLSLLAGSGLRFSSFTTDYRVFFSKDNPELQAFEALERVYAREDNLYLVFKPKSGTVFEPELLAALRELTEAAWKIPFTTRVDSLTNFQHTEAQGDDLQVRDLVLPELELTTEALARIRKIALQEPRLVHQLISPDGATTAINITLTLPRRDQNEAPLAMAHARKLIGEFNARHPDVAVAVTGVVALDNAFTEAALADLTFLVPLMYGVITLTLILFLRSWGGTLAVLGIVGLSVITAMGLAGWLGIQITPPSATAPSIILTLAVADSVHLLVTMFHAMAHDKGKREAIIESLQVNFYPVFLTSFTSVIGYLSLNSSDAPPFRDLGNITAIGVTTAWLYSILTLPALLQLMPLKANDRSEERAVGMDSLARFVIARPRRLLWASTAVCLGFALIIPRIELNDQFVNYFDKRIQFRNDTDFAMKHLSGIYGFDFSLPAGGSGAIAEPAFLAQVEDFTAWLRRQPEVVHVSSLTDIMKRLNKNMHGDDEGYYRLPDGRELAAQYLLLYEMSLPYGLDLNNQINVDKSALRISVTTANITTREARSLAARAEHWLKEHMPSAASAKGTGSFILFAHISQRNIESMLSGTVVSFVLISLSMIVALRHFKLGLLSLIPNTLPLLMTFGLWGLFVGQIGVASSVVVATTLGIIVDDTVHFMSKYLLARRKGGASPEEAVRYAFSTVGSALWVTSMVLIAGFGILALSPFEVNKSMGLLTAITIFVGLLAEFLLLPALLILLDRRKEKRDETELVVATE